MKEIISIVFAICLGVVICFYIASCNQKYREQLQQSYNEYCHDMYTKKVDDEVDLGNLVSFDMVTSNSGGRYRSEIHINYRVAAEKGTVLNPEWCPSFAPMPCKVLYSNSIDRVRFVPQ